MRASNVLPIAMHALPATHHANYNPFRSIIFNVK